MSTPGLANAAVAAGRSIRSLDVPSLRIQNGTTMATWEVKHPIVGAAMQYYSTSTPDEVVASLMQALTPLEPIVLHRPGETLITFPIRRRFGGPSGTTVKCDMTFSVREFSTAEDPEVSPSIQSVIGADYVVKTRPLESNEGVAPFAASVLEDVVFGVATPLDRDGSKMERPSEVARHNESTAIDASEVWELVADS